MEISRKIDEYRGRNSRQALREPQAHLPFPQETASRPTVAPPPPKPRQVERRGRERLEIFVDQPGLQFPSGAIPSPNHALVPVARLGRRALAWLIDMTLLLTCWGMFLGLLAALGVQPTEKKIDLAISVAILFLLYTQYFGLFTVFGGTTPGMQIAHLRAVGFDGNTPTPKQLLWRSFGYVVVGCSGFLGFLWAMWDEDKLCWQDRVSQTYLTSMTPVTESRPAEGHH